MNLCFILFIILLYHNSYISASEGDRSPFYQSCVKNCLRDSCETDQYTFKSSAIEQLSIWSQLLWNCKDECRYKCMWRTVQGYQERGYKVPKFHGKWPFVRVYGIQEPGSALASLLNLITHVYMYNEITRRFSVKTTPLLLFWHIFAVICINAWAWSTIFHTRDNAFTEFMDYACALSMVMALFVAAFVRVFHRRRLLLLGILSAPLLYFVDHVRYLYSGVVDYEYNMLVNLVFGVVGSLVWVSWSWLQVWSGRRYAWRVAAFAVLSGATLALELLDFPPHFGTWDAHALWHLSTAPLPLLFYRFVIDDLRYLQISRLGEKADLKLT